MPQQFNSAVMTNVGARLLTRSQAGEIQIEFTRIAVGNGTYSTVEKQMSSLQARTALKSLKNSYALSKIRVSAEQSVQVTALITNQDPTTKQTLVTAGYYINEMALYAKVKGGDSSTEIMYSIVTTSGEVGDFMPPYNGYNPAQITQDYYATVNNSMEVTIEADAGAVLLAEDANKIIDDTTKKVYQWGVNNGLLYYKEVEEK